MGVRNRLKRLGRNLLGSPTDAAPTAAAPPTPRPAPPPALHPIAAPAATETPAAPPTEAAAPSGFAALARAAATQGLDTGATYRAETPPPVVEGVQEDGDGTRFWGPVNNESARARARGDKLDIDREECIGCGTCVEHTEAVFWLDDDEGKAWVLRQEGSMRAIQGAIDACPVTCISWRTERYPDSGELPPHAPSGV